MGLCDQEGEAHIGDLPGISIDECLFWGSLYQDIPSQIPGAGAHRSAELYDTINHPINFVSGTLLGDLYGHISNPKVNTVHHQAVKQLGQDLEVYAHSDDGFIEAFGYTKAAPGKVMGVQWHPEFSVTQAGKLLDEELIFNVFLEHAKQHRN
nr:gamma-glutamyl-gamma-aminobutyrate hydrolase family protein [Sphingobacterium sp. E70]